MAASDPTKKTLQHLFNIQMDNTVEPPAVVIGIKGKAVDGAYYPILVDTDGALRISAPWDDPIFVDGAVTAQPSTYAMQYDDTGAGGISYQGWATAGTATSAASWRIRKIVQTGNDFAITWADGNTTMDNVWDNRAALSYS